MAGTLWLRRWAHDDCGVTSMEYGMLGVLIAVAIAAAVAAIGTEAGAMFTKVASCFPLGAC